MNDLQKYYDGVYKGKTNLRNIDKSRANYKLYEFENKCLDDFVMRNVKGRVLDIGCGKGHYYHLYKDAITFATLVDPSTSALDSIISNPQTEKISKTFDDAEIRGTYDTILITFLISHLSNDEVEKTFNKIDNLLSENGKVIVIDTSLNEYRKEELSLMFDDAEGYYYRKKERGKVRILKRYFSRNEISDLAIKLGFFIDNHIHHHYYFMACFSMPDKYSKYKRLKALNQIGQYHEALEYYYLHKIEPAPRIIDHLIFMEYGVAFQHAGLFRDAIDIYKKILEHIPSIHSNDKYGEITREDLSYNIKVQKAVLEERLYENPDLIDFPDYSQLDKTVDIRIAKSSLKSWYEVILMKNLANVSNWQELKEHCINLKGKPEYTNKQSLGDWVDLFLEIAEVSLKISNGELIQNIFDHVSLDDKPGIGWFYLAAGKYLASQEFLEMAVKKGFEQGKFFIIGKANQELAKVLKASGNIDQARSRIKIATDAFALCNLLNNDSFRFSLKTDMVDCGMTEKEVVNCLLLNQGVVIPRDKVRINDICIKMAAEKSKDYNREIEAWEIFEDLVQDILVYQLGYQQEIIIRKCSKGTEGNDLIVINEQRTEIQLFQAKLTQAITISELSKGIHSYKGELGLKYEIPKIHYVLCFATTDLYGWDEKLWPKHKNAKLFSHFSNIETATCMLEPEIQSYIVLNPYLRRKYLPYVS